MTLSARFGRFLIDRASDDELCWVGADELLVRVN